MDIAALRRQAIDKRNKAIAQARTEYRLAVQQIADLAHTLGCAYQKPSRVKHKAVLVLMAELVPQDRLFNVFDMMDMLRAECPDREFKMHSLRTFFPQLENQKLIRKVTRDDQGRVLWAAVGLKVESTEFGAMPLPAVAEKILRERGPLTLIELVIEMRRRGFRPHKDPRRSGEVAKVVRTSAIRGGLRSVAMGGGAQRSQLAGRAKTEELCVAIGAISCETNHRQVQREFVEEKNKVASRSPF